MRLEEKKVGEGGRQDRERGMGGIRGMEGREAGKESKLEEDER